MQNNGHALPYVQRRGKGFKKSMTEETGIPSGQPGVLSSLVFHFSALLKVEPEDQQYFKVFKNHFFAETIP